MTITRISNTNTLKQNYNLYNRVYNRTYIINIDFICTDICIIEF